MNKMCGLIDRRRVVVTEQSVRTGSILPLITRVNPDSEFSKIEETLYCSSVSDNKLYVTDNVSMPPTITLTKELFDGTKVVKHYALVDE